MTTFDEKVEMSLENWEDFVKSIKEIHDLSRCSAPLCEVGTFVEKLYSNTFSSRRSPRLVRGFFVNVFKMFPKVFNDVFIAYKNKERVLEFFRQKYQNEPSEHCTSSYY